MECATAWYIEKILEEEKKRKNSSAIHEEKKTLNKVMFFNPSMVFIILFL